MGGDVPLRSDRRRRAGSESASAHQDPRSSEPSVACDEQGRLRGLMQRRPHDWHCDFGRTSFMPRILSVPDLDFSLRGLPAQRSSIMSTTARPGLHPVLARSRRAAARAAQLVVFPNEARAHVAQRELRFSDNKLHIVWNVPRRAELVASAATAEPPLIVYYHGSITPERLPETVSLAVRRMAGRARLRIAGYEAPGARGYVRHLIGNDKGTVVDAPIEYLGMVPRADLLARGRACSCRLVAHAFQLRRPQHQSYGGRLEQAVRLYGGGTSLARV